LGPTGTFPARGGGQNYWSVLCSPVSNGQFGSISGDLRRLMMYPTTELADGSANLLNAVLLLTI
jgi:hypothetical protein